MRYPRLIEFGQVDIALCQAYTPHRDLLRRSGSDRLKDHRRDRVLRIDLVEPRRDQPRIASEPRRLGIPSHPGWPKAKCWSLETMFNEPCGLHTRSDRHLERLVNKQTIGPPGRGLVRIQCRS